MGTLLWRWNFSLALASGRLGNDVRVPMSDLERAVGTTGSREEAITHWWSHLIGRVPSADELQALGSAANAQTQKQNPAVAKAELLGLMLASPAFMRC